MKQLIFFFLLFSQLQIGFTQQNDESSSTHRYQDKLELAKDIAIAIQQHNILKLESITQALTLPYSLYQSNIITLHKTGKAINLNKKYSGNEIHPESWLAKDADTYAAHATGFYFSGLMNEVVNDNGTDTNFNKKIFIAFKNTDSIISDNIKSNNLQILYSTNTSVKVIYLGTLATINNQLFCIRQATYHSYSKDDLPSYLSQEFPKNTVVYQFTNDAFNKYESDWINFNDNDYNQQHTNEIISREPDTDSEILEIAEEMPSFSGGVKGLIKFLNANLRYPKAAIKAKAEGKVFVRFTVEKNGSIKNPMIVKDGVGYDCAEEAIRLVKMMPKWWPGKQNGKAVRVYYTLPVEFKL